MASAPSVQGADSKIAVPSTGEAADQSPAETGDSRAALKTTSEPGPIVSIPSLGIEVRQIDRTTTTKWGLRNAEGLLVEKVDRKGVAFKAGLRSRDIIQKFETKGENILSWRPVPVRTAKALTLGIQEASEHDRRLALIIKRGSFDGLVVFISAPKK